MACTAITILSLLIALYALCQLYMMREERYIAVYQAPIIESKKLFDDFVLSTQGEDLVEPFAGIDYADAQKVGVAGYVPGYDSMNPSAGWTPNTDLEMAAQYGDLGVIGRLATGGGYLTKSMNV